MLWSEGNFLKWAGQIFYIHLSQTWHNQCMFETYSLCTLCFWIIHYDKQVSCSIRALYWSFFFPFFLSFFLSFLFFLCQIMNRLMEGLLAYQRTNDMVQLKWCIFKRIYKTSGKQNNLIIVSCHLDSKVWKYSTHKSSFNW
jgi:hypothetical protein